MVSEARIKANEAERNRKIQGPILRAHVYDMDGCPACGIPNKLEKKYCYGFEPDLGRVVLGFESCNIIGPHLHGTCAVCGYLWLERTHKDDAMIDGRGALRFDEHIDAGGMLVRERQSDITPLPAASAR